VAPLGRKQAIPDDAAWRHAAATARQQVTDAELDQVAGKAVAAVRSELAGGRRVAFGWSGGKDSQVLRWVMEQAGAGECVLAMTAGLEWPAMLRWLSDHMPAGCEARTVPLDLPWLARSPRMLFPQGADGPRWFTLIQHKVQARYYQDNHLDLLALGRRRKDGNFVGPPGQDRYANREGITRWSPLADWTHEHVLALIDREQIPLPPCYGWPRGWQVGTGPWPARQWTTSHDHGWAECWQIDPGVVRAAAATLPQAADWIARTGKA
jgi:3'-phosphoadenosine 5'-phosphosulfate sulfotransferase (PAPS reductase)/FAD synthetase